MDQKAYVVGVGSITGAGNSVLTQWTALKKGGPKFITFAEATEWLPFSLEGLHESFGEKLVCPVKLTNGELGEMAGVNPRGYDRHQLFALVAAAEAMRGVSGFEPKRFACVTATGGAGLIDVYQSVTKLQAGKRLGPRDNLKYLPNLFAGYLTQQYGIRGASEVHGTACAASMHAIISLIRMIRCGEVDGGLVVGAEAAISEFGQASFQAQRAIGNGLVYHKDRSGFVMGEGAAAVVIVNQSLLKRLDVEPLGEIAGYGATSDASQDGAITDPDPNGAARAMKSALAMSGLTFDDVSLVKTHGTATPKGDLSELKAIRKLTNRMVPVMSMKSYFGHLLGAAGIAELAAVMAMVWHQEVLPTRGLNRDSLDPDCTLLPHVLKRSKRPLQNVLLNGFGFGGTNASLLFRTV